MATAAAMHEALSFKAWHEALFVNHLPLDQPLWALSAELVGKSRRKVPRRLHGSLHSTSHLLALVLIVLCVELQLEANKAHWRKRRWERAAGMRTTQTTQTGGLHGP
eukprot:5988594-Pleurochrysis_carterae.AAC.1